LAVRQATTVVSEIPGHSSMAITGDVYGHVAPDVSREAVATLGAVSDSLNYPYASKRRSSVAPGVQAP
jgi:hypothetical protein